MIYYRINAKKTFPTNMLTYLVTNNNYITSIYMEGIAAMKCLPHQFCLEKYFIEQKQ